MVHFSAHEHINGGFSEQNSANLIAEYSSDEKLLSAFKERQAKIRSVFKTRIYEDE